MKTLPLKLLLFFTFLTSITIAQNVGIGTTTPTNTLHVFHNNSTTDPLRVEGLRLYASENQFLVIDHTTGIVKHMPIDSLINEMGNLDSVIIHAILSNSDTIYTNQPVIDSIISIVGGSMDSLLINNADTLYAFIADSLLNDTTWLNTLADSINIDDQNMDSLTLNGTILTTYIENGASANANLLSLASDSAFYSTIRDSLLVDSLFLSQLDSLFLSDTAFINGLVDTFLNNTYFTDSMYTTTRDSLLTDNYYTDSLFTVIRDSLLLDQTTLNSLYTFISDSLLLDTTWLNQLKDSIDTDNQNIDSLTLNGTILTTYIEDGTSANVNLQPIIDSAAANSPDKDSQTIDQFNLSGTTLNLSLQNDGMAPQTVNLSSLQDGTGNDWHTTGNSGTTSSSFLGTTDNMPLIFRTNNSEKMRLTNNDGLLGIGNNNPKYVLDIHDYFTTTGAFLNGDGATMRLSSTGNQGSSYFKYSAGPAFVLEIPVFGYSERMTSGIYFNRMNENVEWFIGTDAGVFGSPLPYPSQANDKFYITRKLKSTNTHETEVSSYSNTMFLIDSMGRVGIGLTAPTYKLELPNNSSTAIGQGRAYAWNTYSDGRLKTNRHELTYGLNEIMKIKPLSYYHHNSFIHHKDENNQFQKLEIKESYSKQIGFIAQELHKIIPEAVNPPKNEEFDLWTVDYTRLIPVLVKAIQEQQEQLNYYKKQNEELKNTIQNIDERLKKIENKQEITPTKTNKKRLNTK